MGALAEGHDRLAQPTLAVVVLEMHLQELPGNERKRVAVGAVEGEMAYRRREHVRTRQSQHELFGHGCTPEGAAILAAVLASRAEIRSGA